MLELQDKRVLVIGLSGRGWAACEFLRRSGARVVGVDNANNPDLRHRADRLRPLGVEVLLGASAPPEGNFSLAGLGSSLAANTPLVDAVHRNKVPLISELELALQQSHCLSIAIAGTNGKATTAELVERVLVNNHRKAILSGHRARPVSARSSRRRRSWITDSGRPTHSNSKYRGPPTVGCRADEPCSRPSGPLRECR